MSASKPRESRPLARLDELRALPSRQGVFEAGDRARSEQRAQAVAVQRCDRDLLEPRRASVSHLVRRSGRAAPEGQIEGRPRSPSRARPLHATTRTSRCERLPSRCAAPTERRQRRRRLVLSPACSGGPAQPLSADLGGRLLAVQTRLAICARSASRCLASSTPTSPMSGSRLWRSSTCSVCSDQKH